MNEGMITKEEAIMKVEPRQLDALLHPQFDPKALKNAKPIARGLAASPGAACGQIYFTSADSTADAKAGQTVVMVRAETSPEDIEGMNHARGILTSRGGMTSHAAVVARGMGTCCVAGCSEIRIDEANKVMYVGDRQFAEGDFLSIDGSTGNVYGESIPTVDADVTGDFATIMGWADSVRRLKVRTNADTPHDAEVALRFGAEGIGLTRTEHMFFAADRIAAMREMILADTESQRRIALNKILPMQKEDFKGIYRVMGELPVTIRYLDPPLHEFLPSKNMTAEIQAIAKELDTTPDAVVAKIDALHEFNPMMGHRGCRLSVTYSEIAEMRPAPLEAAIEVTRDGPCHPSEIMIPWWRREGAASPQCGDETPKVEGKTGR